MTIISLLLVLAIERMTTKTKLWQSDFYLSQYQQFLHRQEWLVDASRQWSVYFALFLPAIITWLILDIADSTLLSFVTGFALLMVATGCPHIRAKYKGYLQAANRGDFAARDLYAEQLGYSAEEKDVSFGQHIIWLNYKYYYAVAVWFVLLGAPGVAAYLVVRHFAVNAEADWVKASAQQCQHWLDWIPVRIAALGFLLVGHFSKALPIWLSMSSELETDARRLLITVAKASEDVEPVAEDCTEEPCTLLRLAKRNVMMLLAVVAVLTLAGWLQ
ncbi:MAG: beta-lactamase regulator AmpE [Aestuariibacter sp.]